MHQMIKDDPDVPLMLRNQTELREHVRFSPSVASPDAHYALSQVRGDSPDQFSLLANFHPDFKYLSNDELPQGVTHGATFKAIM